MKTRIGKRLQKPEKGEMARQLVYFCIRMLTLTAIWSMCLKTYGAIHNVTVDLSDVLTFIGAAFGGELLFLLLKRILAKPTDTTEQEESENEIHCG